MEQIAMILLKGLEIYTENSKIQDGFLQIKNGKIEKYGSMDECPTNTYEYEVYDFHHKLSAIPGMIDLHIHGVAGADMMDGTKQALETITLALPREGTTSFLATTITQSSSKIEEAIVNVSNFMDSYHQSGNAELLGIHLEGPFISSTHIGAQSGEHISNANIELFMEYYQLAKGRIKVITLAPEIENGFLLVKAASETGVIVSVGHSNATYEQVREAVKCGLSHTTHLYNQMRHMHHREPGAVGAAFLLEQIKVEIIPDGIHVHPLMVKMAYDVIGKDRLIIITDSMRAKGLADGSYELGGQQVTVKDSKATLNNGTLAGSTLKMIDGLKNIVEYTGCSLHDAIKLTSVNPAKQINVFDRKGSIAEGKDADIVILDENLNIKMTICRGKIAYVREEHSK
jgi:N-acetylglucosamine-6-phosphate deacetylase